MGLCSQGDEEGSEQTSDLNRTSRLEGPRFPRAPAGAALPYGLFYPYMIRCFRHFNTRGMISVRVLFLLPYPTEGASNRLRIEQYLSYLQDRGVRWKVSPFMSKRLYAILYQRGHLFEKVVRSVWGAIRRLWNLLRTNRYDLVVIHRRAFPIWTPFSQYLIRRIRRPIVFDFDDAVFLKDQSTFGRRLLSFLKRPGKVASLIAQSSHVIAGNEFLKEYALQFNDRVHVLPTPVETDTYRVDGTPPDPSTQDRLVLGWIGSRTTAPYLRALDDVFRELLTRFPTLEIQVVGGEYDGPLDRSRIQGIPWCLEREYEALRAFDVGIMPLRDDEWERYKCGFKALLYMSMEIPVVCSPVGVNRKIVTDGVNGFVAQTPEEWVEKISRLLSDSALRRRMGREGRKTVEAHYSVRRNASRFFEILELAGRDKFKKDAARFSRLQQKTQRSFDYQWTHFPDMAPANEKHFLNYIHPVQPEFFQGKLGLDAACGFGRHLYYAAGFGPRHMVGMDFSNAIFSARQTNRSRSNISLVKGDIYRMPFKRGAFDFIYSLGALHHLPDPEEGFRSLFEFVKPEGAVAIWVYSKRRRLVNFFTERVRSLTRRIPLPTLMKISFLFAGVDYFAFIFPYSLLRRLPLVERFAFPRVKLYARFPFFVCYADWFDRFSAPLRHYFDKEELEDWGRRVGLRNILVTPTGKYGWRLYGERAPSTDAEIPAELSALSQGRAAS